MQNNSKIFNEVK